MSNKKKLLPVPEMRFPEYRGTEGWQQLKLGSIATFFKGKGLPKSALVPNGKNPCIHYGELFTEYQEVIDAIKSRTNLKENVFLSAKDDVIMPTSDVTPSGLAKACSVKSDNIILGADILIIRANKHAANGEFLARYIRHLERKVLQLVSGSTVFHLYASSMEGLALSFPEIPEQQKIADCLRSLDELIAAQARKVEALKIHKKALKQQLFPREGETKPILRFPEFQDNEWQLKKIGSMLAKTSRPIDMQDDTQYSLVTVKRRYGGVISRELLNGRDIKVKSQFVIKTDDFIISKRQIVHNACGLVPAELTGSIVSNEYSVLTPRKGCEVRFFAYFSQQPSVSQSFMQASVGIVIEKMLFKLDFWLKKEFLFPNVQEQKRIAECLSSLDRLIDTATQELEALKTHKMGLMQQLFPPAEALET